MGVLPEPGVLCVGVKTSAGCEGGGVWVLPVNRDVLYLCMEAFFVLTVCVLMCVACLVPLPCLACIR